MKIVCEECGYKLYEGDTLKSPEDTAKKYDNCCPECNRNFLKTEHRVIILPDPGHYPSFYDNLPENHEPDYIIINRQDDRQHSKKS